MDCSLTVLVIGIIIIAISYLWYYLFKKFGTHEIDVSKDDIEFYQSGSDGIALDEYFEDADYDEYFDEVDAKVAKANGKVPSGPKQLAPIGGVKAPESKSVAKAAAVVKPDAAIIPTGPSIRKAAARGDVASLKDHVAKSAITKQDIQDLITDKVGKPHPSDIPPFNAYQAPESPPDSRYVYLPDRQVYVLPFQYLDFSDPYSRWQYYYFPEMYSRYYQKFWPYKHPYQYAGFGGFIDASLIAQAEPYLDDIFPKHHSRYPTRARTHYGRHSTPMPLGPSFGGQYSEIGPLRSPRFNGAFIVGGSPDGFRSTLADPRRSSRHSRRPSMSRGERFGVAGIEDVVVN